MLKETITYEDFEGVQRTKTLYFNLTKLEVLKLEQEHGIDGDLQKRIEQVGESRNGKQIMEFLEIFMKAAYGERTLDGGFDKNPELFERFKVTQAYSDFFFAVCTDAEKMIDFVHGLISGAAKGVTREQVAEKMREQSAERGDNVFEQHSEPHHPAPPAKPQAGPRPPKRPSPPGMQPMAGPEEQLFKD